MKPELHYCLRPALYCCLFVLATSSSTNWAMSHSPDEATEITTLTPVVTAETKAAKLIPQYENSNPEADAQTAIENGDLRLLGFALRMTSVPGVAAADRQAAMDECGIRLLGGFGDVIHRWEDMTARQQAHEYAARYNAVVVEQCFKDN